MTPALTLSVVVLMLAVDILRVVTLMPLLETP